MSKRLKRKHIVAAIEQQIVEEHDDLAWDDHQHSRAYHSGLMDGLGFALKLLKPNSSVISLTSVWFEDEPTQTERLREQLIELQYVDMSDPETCYAGLFETEEAT
jgi:hypothetical protein